VLVGLCMPYYCTLLHLTLSTYLHREFKYRTSHRRRDTKVAHPPPFIGHYSPILLLHQIDFVTSLTTRHILSSCQSHLTITKHSQHTIHSPSPHLHQRSLTLVHHVLSREHVRRPRGVAEPPRPKEPKAYSEQNSSESLPLVAPQPWLISRILTIYCRPQEKGTARCSQERI